MVAAMETWFCPRCRAVNVETAPICHGCRAERPAPEEPATHRTLSVNLPLPKSLQGKVPDSIDIKVPTNIEVPKLAAVKRPAALPSLASLPRLKRPTLRRPKRAEAAQAKATVKAKDREATSFTEKYRGTEFDPYGFSKPSGRRGRRRLVVGGLVLLLSVAAVGGIGAVIALGGGQNAGPVEASPSPTPLPTIPPSPTPTPEPTPEIPEVILAMHAILTDPDFSGRWETVTTLESSAGVQELTRMSVERAGNDDHTTSSILADPDGARETLEQIRLDDRVYHRPGKGSPWTARLRKAADTVAVPMILGDDPSTLVLDGRGRYQGERLTRVSDARLARDMEREFEDAFKSRAAEATSSAASTLVRPDGTPVVLVVKVEGELDGGATPVVFMLTTTYTDIGAPIEISLENAARD
jgi:hypothetical protein